jgi:hypothetical protein
MRLLRIFTVLVLALSFPLAAAEGTKVTLDVSGFFLTRAAGTAAPLVSQNATPGTGDIFTTDSVALNSWKPGIDLRLGLSWSRLGAELHGFMLGKWSNSAVFSVAGFTNVILETNPHSLYSLPAGGTLTANNESTFKGFEANLTYALSPAVCLYGGLRYLLVDEMFDFYGQWGASGEDDVWNTTNKMLGGQVGVRFDFMPQAAAAAEGFTLGGHCAVALFSNSAHVDCAVVGTIKTSLLDASQFSPAVDAGLKFGYRFGSVVELHAGYDLIWLSSVAKAADQVSGTTALGAVPISTLVFSNLLVHGAKAGLTFRF